MLCPIDTIIEACQKEKADILGLTVLQLDTEEALTDLRRKLPRRIRLMAGGPVFSIDPEMADRVGIDFVARDAGHFIHHMLKASIIYEDFYYQPSAMSHNLNPMNFLNGIRYNLRGLMLGLKTPKLLMLGIARFVILLLFSVAGAALALSYYDDALRLVWVKPESLWIVWLWYLVSWLTAIVMVGVSTILAYLVSQLLFSVVIMDLMSRITEKTITGEVMNAPNASFFRQLLFLIRQEIPRAVIPMVCLLLIMLLGWFTPIAPLLSILSSALAAVFLAWDHTDLVPARRMATFSKRFSMLLKTFFFHLGFGLLFLIPVVNILLLSFAPVGATLFHTDNK